MNENDGPIQEQEITAPRSRPPLTPEQRKEIGQRLLKGRQMRAAEVTKSGGEFRDSPHAPPTLAELRHQLAAITPNWVKDNCQNGALGLLARDLTAALEIIQAEDMRATTLRNAEACSICHRAFPNGRFVSERSWFDPASNNIRTLRSCSEACTREIDKKAMDFNTARQGNQQPRRIV